MYKLDGPVKFVKDLRCNSILPFPQPGTHDELHPDFDAEFFETGLFQVNPEFPNELNWLMDFSYGGILMSDDNFEAIKSTYDKYVDISPWSKSIVEGTHTYHCDKCTKCKCSNTQVCYPLSSMQQELVKINIHLASKDFGGLEQLVNKLRGEVDDLGCGMKAAYEIEKYLENKYLS